MAMNVFDLAQEDTRLTRVARYATKGNGPEYAGPCPRCHSTDSFHVQPERREGGAWMCRKCWPAESNGWADSIEYLRQFRGMSFTAAQSFLAGKVETAIERVEQAHNKKLEQYGKPPNQVWQDRAAAYAEQAQAQLWTSEGRAGLDYLLSRGLSESTIEAARLGYAAYRGVPCVVIPWYADGAYWRINLRDIRPDRPDGEKRYHNVPGSSNAGLFLGDSLRYGRPVFMVEGELDALSIAQEAGELVSVVATGSTSGSRTDKWVARLAMSPAVLVAYDNEPQAEKDAKYWLRVLEHNAIRYRPILYKDANAMLIADRELVRTWVTAALDYVSDQDQDAGSQSVQAALPTENTLATPEPGFICSVCKTDLADNERTAYGPDDLPYCDYKEDTGAAYCSRGHDRKPETREQFLEYANLLAAGLNERTGESWTVTPIEPGYTLDRHIAGLRELRAATEPTRAIESSNKPAHIPAWLVPGSKEWNDHVDFLHLGPRQLRDDFPGVTGQCATRKAALLEMRERRAAWDKQKGLS